MDLAPARGLSTHRAVTSTAPVNFLLTIDAQHPIQYDVVTGFGPKALFDRSS